MLLSPASPPRRMWPPRFRLWNPATENWDDFPGFDYYGQRWWYSPQLGVHTNATVVHRKHITTGPLLQFCWYGFLDVCTHPKLPGRFLGYFW